MNTPDTEITHHGIILIQSLKESDRKTGDELHKDILQYKQYLREDSFVELYNVATVEEFIWTLENINKAMTKGKIFSLHIETHGSEDGIHLASRECMTWKQFYDNIRPINIKMGNLLMVIMSMCKGGALVSYIEPEKRAPYLAFIGAFRNLTEDEVARGFSAFYDRYSNALDISAGMEALDAEIDGINPQKKTFWCLTSESIFDSIFDPDRDPENFRKMVREQLFNHISRGETDYTWARVENNIRNLLRETSKKHKDYYCFKDFYKK